MTTRLALLGAREGPWLDLTKVKRPVLKVINLPEGASVRVEANDSSIYHFRSNGHHVLPSLTWVRVCCDAPSGHRTICVFLTKAA